MQHSGTKIILTQAAIPFLEKLLGYENIESIIAIEKYSY